MESQKIEFTMSRYLQVLAIDEEHSLVAHGPALRRSVLKNDITANLEFFHKKSCSQQEFIQRSGLPGSMAHRIFAFFVENSYIVPAGENEEDKLQKGIGQKLIEQLDSSEMFEATSGNRFEMPIPVSFKSFSTKMDLNSEMFDSFKIVLLGGCFMQSAASIIEDVARHFRFQVQVTAGWPEDFHLIRENEARLVVFQPATMWLLGPLWDQFAFVDDGEIERRLQIIKDYLSLVVNKLMNFAQGRLVLIQGICPPQIPPHGRMDFRLRISFYQIVFEINKHLQELIRQNLNAIFVDEARLFSNYGVSFLMDDMINVYSHHAPIDFSTAPWQETEARLKSFRIRNRMLATRLLAKEYFECYRLLSGKHKIKCIVVDLDNTLWPGEVGDSKFSLTGYKCFEYLRYGRMGGLHQALKILKNRGVLLATCSRNDYAEVMKHWGELGDNQLDSADTKYRTSPPAEGETLYTVDYLLRPKDFVIHKINWKRKSENVVEIAQELGISLDSILFIDDNPVQREEVKTAFPEVRTLGADMNLVRLQLLSDPNLEFNTRTPESKLRTEMMKAQLKRTKAAHNIPDESTFLKSLKIEIRVNLVINDSNIERLAELLERTNQFNTTGLRLDVENLRTLLTQPETKIYVAEVIDRFGDYGMVGVCFLQDGRIENFVMSCRVIELKVAHPFLVAAIKVARLTFPITARLIKTKRNLPCHTLYLDAGFEQVKGDEFILRDDRDLKIFDEKIYAVNVH